MTTSTIPESNRIREILLQVEPEAGDLPEQFLSLICDESAQGKEVQISEETSGDPFLTWDQVKHIAEVATLIATCLTIVKTTLDIATIKKKLPPAVANHPATDKIIAVIIVR